MFVKNRYALNHFLILNKYINKNVKRRADTNVIKIKIVGILFIKESLNTL
jgi:hypothetical protein